MIQLIANEIKLNEMKIGSENFIVTDKRLLYENGISDAFIGMNELRGAEIKEENYTFNKFNLPNMQNLGIICMFICLAIIFIYFTVKFETLESGLAGMICTGVGLGVPSAIVMVLLLNFIQKLTSYTETKITFQVTKTDNTLWLNQYYDLPYKDKLDELRKLINNIVYK